MLGKVLKYDIKACARLYLPMYLIFAVIVLITKIYILVSPDAESISGALFGLIMTSYTFAVIGMALLTEIFLVVYFYRKCISREGYLTFTLPVKTGTHLLSQCLNSALWHVLSYGLLILSVFVFFSWKDMQSVFQIVTLAFSFIAPIDMTWPMIFFLLTIIIGLFSAPLMFFASMAIGQIVTRHKVLASVGIYIAFYVVFSMISSFGSTFLYIGSEVLFGGDVSVSTTVLSAFSFFLTVIQAGLYYFLTYYFLDKKLNLT